MILQSKKLKRKAVVYAIFSIILFSSLPLFIFFHGSSLQLNSRTIKDLPSTSDTLSSEWYNAWGGSSDDYGYGIAVDGSGNAFITGSTDSYGTGGYEDVLLLKYNSSGNLLWYKTWGGPFYDYGYGIAVDGSGNAFITGSTDSYGTGNSDAFLLKYDSSGSLLWYKTWGGSENDGGSGIALDGSGNVFISGATDSYGAGQDDVFLLKYDSSGNLQWNTTWGGSSDEFGSGIALDALGNAFITGYTLSYGAGGYDALLLKYDSSGSLLWNKTWGGSDHDSGGEITVDGSGNAFISGVTDRYGAGYRDALVLKYDSFGNLLWYKTWGGSRSDSARGIVSDGSGNVFITGVTYTYGPYGFDVILLKYDSSGSLLWYKIWGGTDDDSGESGHAIAIDGSGNAFITGYTSYYAEGTVDVFLLKYGVDTDEDGLIDGWEVKYGLNATWSGDASLDGDNDGLTNLEEYKFNVDPTDSDTDDDGLNDGDEVNVHETDPNDSDTDGDGFSDSQEIQMGTDPLSAFSNLFITSTIIIVIVISVGAVSLFLIIKHHKKKRAKQKERD